MTPGPEGDWKGDGAMSAMCCAMIPRCEFSCARGRVWGVECPFGMASAAFQTCPYVVFVAIALPVTCEGLVLSMLGDYTVRGCRGSEGAPMGHFAGQVQYLGRV